MKASTFSSRQPVLADARSCEAWLARASLADPKQACQELTALLEALEELPPDDRSYLDILERLREPIAISLAEQAKKLLGRPLPLRDFEETAFDQMYDLWRAIGRSYRRLLASATGNATSAVAADAPLLAQRALDAVAELMLTHYRCRREVDVELWRDLNQLARIADEGGYGGETVPASLRSKSVSSCDEVYVRALLLALSNPYALGGRELQWARRWATLWAYKVDLVTAADDVQGYAVDLASDQPPTWIRADASRPTTRFLEMSALRKSVKSRMKKLDAGVDPQTLGLGKDCVQPDVGRLLGTLARNWLDAPSPRQFTRRPVPGRVELVTGFETIHTAITGRGFKGGARHWDYSRRDADQLAIYQNIAAVNSSETPVTVPTEVWESLDESANGFRLCRKGGGARLAHQQLIALKPQDARSFILSEVRWLMIGIDRAFTLGAAALPGLAKGVAVRPMSLGTAQEPFTQAFLLPASPGGREALVLPTGWSQNGRELELRIEEELVRVRLGPVLQRGYDFDRVAFDAVA